MESDGKIQQFVLLSRNARGRAAADLVSKATAEPGMFAFGELLDQPSIVELQGSAFHSSWVLLGLFSYGTWSDFKVLEPSLPPLSQRQVVKLKQLTVVSLATKDKVVPYCRLTEQLDIPTVRELEDFIITECFYTNIIKGKLDQKQQYLQVHNSIGRDVKLEQVPELVQGLATWINVSDELLQAIEDRVAYAAQVTTAAKKHQEEVDKQIDEVKKNLKAEMDVRLQEGFLPEEAMELVEEERITGRPKRWS